MAGVLAGSPAEEEERKGNLRLNDRVVSIDHVDITSLNGACVNP